MCKYEVETFLPGTKDAEVTFSLIMPEKVWNEIKDSPQLAEFQKFVAESQKIQEKIEGRNVEEDKMQKILERIFFELRYLKENQNPPVNYAAVILTSIIISVATTLIVLRL